MSASRTTQKELLSLLARVADFDALRLLSPKLYADIIATLEEEDTMINVGDEVFWADPDEGICSGNGKVTEVNGEIYSVKKDDGGELEAYEYELTLNPEP